MAQRILEDPRGIWKIRGECRESQVKLEGAIWIWKILEESRGSEMNLSRGSEMNLEEIR